MDTLESRPEHKKLSKRAKSGLCACAGILGICAVGGYLFFRILLQTFGMTNQIYQETSSPGGKYMATLAYRDGLTFGYEYLSLQPKSAWHPLRADDPIPSDEVAEMGDEGIESVVWLNPCTLVIKYDESTPAECFVKRFRSWRGVQIVWRGVGASSESGQNVQATSSPKKIIGEHHKTHL